jgi:response regulator RpfG family c-di-GMP phosphodiesterase
MTPSERTTVLLAGSHGAFREQYGTALIRNGSFDVVYADDGNHGILLTHELTPPVIVAEAAMSFKSGYDFCRYVKECPGLSRTAFIIIGPKGGFDGETAGADSRPDEYVEEGADPAVLVMRIKSVVARRGLEKELAEERERTAMMHHALTRSFADLVAILVKVLEVNIPGAGDRARVARSAAGYICGKLELPKAERRRITFAAALHEIGKIGLPDHAGKGSTLPSSPIDMDQYHRYPVIGSIILASVSGFREAAIDVCHQLEDFDGSGLPDGLVGEEISVGARILRAVVLQEELFLRGLTTDEVVRHIMASANKALDPQVGSALIEFLLETKVKGSPDVLAMTLEDLRAGMVVAEDVYAASGGKLLPKGARLQDRMLELILERNGKDPIVGGIRVFRPTAA